LKPFPKERFSMLQLSRRVDSDDDIARLFSDKSLSAALAGASGILAQVFWNGSGEAALEGVCAAVLRLAPKAVLVGLRSAGQLAEGELVREGIVLSVSCFAASTLKAFSVDDIYGKEEASGCALASSLAACRDLKAALLLAPPLAIDASSLVRGLRGALPSLALFGGGSSEGRDPRSGILYGGKQLARGAVAVALCGPELRVDIASLFDWLPLGPAMTLTEVEGGRIRSIDGKPAFDHYRSNLDIQDGDDLYLLEVPLLIERDGRLIARNTLSAEDDGAIRIGADLFSGETARLGYLDAESLRENVVRISRSLRSFCPEGIFLYSCVCRLYTLQEGVESETMPFQAIAPACGVYTSGEFIGSGGEMRLLNSSEVVVALREGPPSPLAGRSPPSAFKGSNPARERHARMTGHLFRFIGALTESLGAEVIERKKAEEQAKAASSEKEMLLRELQHRVKNSMSVISSIASIEARQSASPEARAALQKLESRISALASLYDLLYASGEVEEIALGEYVRRVVDYAAESLGADAKCISISRVVEDVRIDVKRAISIGLVVNELVTDSVKYAFPSGCEGRLDISLKREGGDIVLRIEDDGVGLPGADQVAGSSGFGLMLVKSLASQLDAEFSSRSEGGARFELRLPL
jgi:two-component sensor histidine kinase